MRRILALMMTSVLLGGCAPRMKGTHFDRWLDQTAKRKEEEEKEERVQAWLRAQAAAEAPTATASGEVGTTTSTDSRRVVRPDETVPIVPKDEAIH